MSRLQREDSQERQEGSSWLGWGLTGVALALGGLTAWHAHSAEKSYQRERGAHLLHCQSAFVAVEDLIDSGELQLGDLIEFRRANYQHWALYIGDGKVVHLTNSNTVQVVDIRKVAEGCPCRINLLEKKAKELGLERWMTRELIVAKAMKKLGQVLKYDVVDYNCEHFVTECFYGAPFSGQQEILLRNGTIRHSAKLVASISRYE